MGIEKISNSITNLLQKARKPLTYIPAGILACGLLKRPGLSPMMIASNIIRRQSEYGGDPGPNEDGSPNQTNALIYIIVEEIVKAIKMDGLVRGVAAKGSMTFTGTGVNAGGPVVVTGTNTNDVVINGIFG